MTVFAQLEVVGVGVEEGEALWRVVFLEVL
jgi:hypothetical protein